MQDGAAGLRHATMPHVPPPVRVLHRSRRHEQQVAPLNFVEALQASLPSLKATVRRVMRGCRAARAAWSRPRSPKHTPAEIGAGAAGACRAAARGAHQPAALYRLQKGAVTLIRSGESASC